MQSDLPVWIGPAAYGEYLMLCSVSQGVALAKEPGLTAQVHDLTCVLTSAISMRCYGVCQRARSILRGP